MTFKPLPHYFIVKIEIEKQKERKEKIGSLYLHYNEIQMQRNLQNGEIVAIGSLATKQFPQANIGDTLIIHHFVESMDKENSNFIYSDKTYNYYNVTSSVYNGHRNESYGVWNGKEIIPHPDFIFIEPEIKEKEVSTEEFIELNTKQVGSLILFNNWEESREAKEEKAKVIMEEIKQSSKGLNLRDDVKIGLQGKQDEAERITASLNRKEYIPLKIAAYNPKLQRSYNRDLKTVSKIFALNIAAQLTIEFMDKEYIVVETKYCVAIAS